MRRYDINIDIPAGSRVDETTLREILPQTPWRRPTRSRSASIFERSTIMHDVRGLSPDECRDYIEMRTCVQPGLVPLAWSPSAQAPVCVGPESGRWTLAGRDLPPDEVAGVWRAICRDHGITSDEMASRLGVHPRTVGLWRAGRITVSAARGILAWLASRQSGD